MDSQKHTKLKIELGASFYSIHTMYTRSLSLFSKSSVIFLTEISLFLSDEFIFI